MYKIYESNDYAINVIESVKEIDEEFINVLVRKNSFKIDKTYFFLQFFVIHRSHVVF
jgi:hypothetical protein